MPYLVDFVYFQRLTTDAAGKIDRIVARQSESIRHGADGVERGMREIVTGRLNEDDGHIYGHAMKQFCEYYGRSLPNDKVMPISLRAIEEFDAEVRAAGVTELAPLRFCDWRPPIPLPPPADFPMVATFDRETCTRGAAEYARALPALAESEWRPAAVQVARWLRASRDELRVLVVFVY